MKLGVISDCVHYKLPNGKVGTENHIFLRQLQTLSTYFSETLICCPFDKYDPAKVISTYPDNIKFTPVPVVGGDTLKDKFDIISAIPKWLKAYRKISSFSDIVYQRFPNNLNILGFFYFWFKKRKVFGTYTGTWKDYDLEPSTYKFQRWLLTNYFKGPVWVYSSEASNNSRILPGFSPSYSKREWDEETEQVKLRIDRLQQNGLTKFRLITVGTLIDYKNQTGIIKACVILKKKGLPFTLTIVGDGPMRGKLETIIVENNLHDEIKMVGKKQYAELRTLYRQHDFVVQAPLAEGFGKVPIEGFFHGVIPVISNTSMAKYMTGNEERGFLFDASNEVNLAETLIRIKDKQALLPAMILNGREFAKSQTLEAWAEEYYKTVTEYFV